MPQQGDVHVVPREGQWAIEIEGSGPDDARHETQEQAIAAARSIAQRNDTELLIHGEDGQIRERDTEGHDPRDVPG